MPRTPKQEEFLAAARKSQEIMVDAIRTWTETVRTATPRLSSVYAQYAERLPKVPSVSVPLTGKLPTAHEAVASAYDLAERLLASQRKFAEDVVKTTRPLMPGFGVTKPQDVRGGAVQDHSESTSAGRGEAAAQETAPQETAPQETAPQKTAPQVTAAEQAPKTTAAKSTPKTTATPRTRKSTPATRAPKSTATKRAPKSTDAG